MQVFNSLKEKVGSKVEKISAGLSDTVHAGKRKLSRHGGASDVVIVRTATRARNVHENKSSPWVIHCESRPSKDLDLLQAHLVVNGKQTSLALRVSEVWIKIQCRDYYLFFFAHHEEERQSTTTPDGGKAQRSSNVHEETLRTAYIS